MKEKILEFYDLIADRVKARVEIVFIPEEYVPIYRIKIPKLEKGTLALLDEIRDKLVSEMQIKTTDLLDPVMLEGLKKKFYSKCTELVEHQFGSLSSELKGFLAGSLVQEMLGLGKLEMLLEDGNLEEIVINSSKDPVWVYHKKHGWLKSNITVPSESQIQNYASAIGRRVGRQITTLDPLLDAHLITGDRVNATLFPISTAGNTITIRKFRRKPWTITDLIENKTTSADVAALIWLATQYELNTIISGGTGSGKCVDGDASVFLSDGSKKRIRDIVEEEFSKENPIKTNDGWFTSNSTLEVLSMNPSSLKIIPTKVSSVWKRKATEELIQVVTRTGKTVITTPEHPFFIINNGIQKIRADKLKQGNRIATIPEKTMMDAIDSISKLHVSWDEVLEIKKVKPKEKWVYDLTVEPYHNFVVASNGGIIVHNTTFLNCLMPFIPPNQRILSIEDTRELSLPNFLHWIPLTVREPNPEGKGGIDMIDLLVNSLRMRPDRIIVGEIRRQRQAEVLFEAMHTGHSVYATVHADTATQTYRRLVNPPINVPETLLEAVDLIVVMFRDRRRGLRRVYEVAEFIPMSEEAGKAGTTIRILFRWKPAKDTIEPYEESYKLMEKLRMHTGMLDTDIKQDLKEKQQILDWMVEKKVNTVDAVGKVIAEYYRNPENVLSIVNKKQSPEKLISKEFMGET